MNTTYLILGILIAGFFFFLIRYAIKKHQQEVESSPKPNPYNPHNLKD